MDILQLIPSISKRETEAGSIYFTSPMRLLQKTIIDDTKTIDAMPSAIKLEEKKKQIVLAEARTLFIELSNNIRQLPQPLAFLDHLVI